MTTLPDKQRSATSRVQGPDETTLDRVLSRIDALAPMVARLAPDIDQGRRLPAELVSALKSARIYGMLVPRRYGGLQLDAPSAFRAVAALAKLDGSVGWNAMIGHIGALAPFLASRTLCDLIYQDGKDHVIAASGQPVGKAECVAGGWRVAGSWPFVGRTLGNPGHLAHARPQGHRQSPCRVDGRVCSRRELFRVSVRSLIRA
jgi:alkylation response protein AidB-like acyl-CoA dehydrogenase